VLVLPTTKNVGAGAGTAPAAAEFHSAGPLVPALLELGGWKGVGDLFSNAMS
jgi:hypothetical protein